MTPDDLQQAWQAQSSETHVSYDADALLQVVERSQRDFQSTILGRDMAEIGTSLVLIPVWFIMGAVLDLPWTWYLVVPGLVWIAAFMFIDRRLHKQKPVSAGDPLVDSAAESLRQVEHQIWLLRNVLWWYLLPLAIPMTAFFIQVGWESSLGWLAAFCFTICMIMFVTVIYGFIYFMNQYAVRTQLVPRQRELLALLGSLGDETASPHRGDIPDYPVLRKEVCTVAPRRRLLASLIALALLLLGMVLAYLAYRFQTRSVLENGYRKESPFAAVRWQGAEPLVQVDGTWFALVAIDDLPADQIVAFSRRTYSDKWQKRFEEDLVELLSRMGHSPGETVTLVVRPLGSSQPQTLAEVPLTRANREAIRDAARAAGQ